MMAQYLTPFPGFKKSVILDQKEEELRHAIRHDVSPPKLLRAAERVRAAKLNLLRAKRHSRKPLRDDDVPSKRIKSIDRETAEWTAMTVENIIETYTTKEPDKPVGGD